MIGGAPCTASGRCGFVAGTGGLTHRLAVRRTASGESPFSPDVLTRIVRAAVAARQDRPRLDGLTYRERDVLALLSEGLSNAEIAERPHVAVSTVKTHVTGLMTKTGVTNRVKLAVLARSHR